MWVAHTEKWLVSDHPVCGKKVGFAEILLMPQPPLLTRRGLRRFQNDETVIADNSGSIRPNPASCSNSRAKRILRDAHPALARPTVPRLSHKFKDGRTPPRFDRRHAER